MPSKRMNRIALVLALLMAGCQSLFADTVYQYVVVWDKLTPVQQGKLLKLGNANTDKWGTARLLPSPTTKYYWLECVPADTATIANYENIGALILIQKMVRTPNDIQTIRVNKLPLDFAPTVLP